MESIVRRRRVFIAVLIWILFLPGVDHPLFAQSQFDSGMARQLELHIADLMGRAQVPGASVAIVQRGQIVYSHGFGVRDKGTPDRVTPETLMMIGSTGKSMTTMMMATLVDQGKISWNTPAVKIYPGLALSDSTLTSTITLRNMVCNCTGIQRHDLEMQFPTRSTRPEDVIRSLRNMEFTGAFGKTFGYVNQMVAAGGYIAAWSAREPGHTLYENYLAQMQRNVFDPIGMRSTTFSFKKVQANPDHAAPHGQTGGGEYVAIPLRMEKMLEPFAPAGVSWSNAHDAARYLITQLNQGIAANGTRVVSAENLSQTWKPEVEIQPGIQYGLGWIIGTYQGRRILTHAGGTAGFTSDLTFMPDAGLGIVVLANAQNADLFVAGVRSRIIELVFGQPSDSKYSVRLEQSRKQFDQRKASVRPFDRRAVSAYLNRFENPSLGVINLKINRGGKFILEIPGLSTELRSVENETYLLWDPPLAGDSIRFSKSIDGVPTFVLVSESPDFQEKYTFTRSQ